MKKFISLFVLVLLLSVNAFAANIVDDAGLLTSTEINNLELMTESIYDEYNFDIAVVTVNSTDGKTIEEFADDYYDYNGYGYGESFDGMIFVIDMSEREFTSSTCGNGIYLFSDYTLDNIHNEIIPYLSSGEYFTAFSEYLNLTEYVLYSAYTETSQPVPDIPSTEEYFPEDIYNEDLYTYEDTDGDFYLTFEIGAVIVSLIIGLITVSVMKSGMKNIGIQKNANIYTKPGDLFLTRSVDRFMYSNVTKTRINTDSNNGSGRSGSSFGGGHSSTRIGSSGRTHGGRSGRF
ncbi:MAG: TPM domain-containing protein [Clostridia bacterium]|nr:TPM domain-containing protein [Clostridia bacterium]